MYLLVISYIDYRYIDELHSCKFSPQAPQVVYRTCYTLFRELILHFENGKKDPLF